MRTRILIIIIALAPLLPGCGGIFRGDNRPLLPSPPPPVIQDALVTNVGAPTAIAFTPDGRLLITTLQGQLRVFQNGNLLATPALDLTSRTCSNGERGLLGLAVDPDIANNNFIYLYYSTLSILRSALRRSQNGQSRVMPQQIGRKSSAPTPASAN